MSYLLTCFVKGRCQGVTLSELISGGGVSLLWDLHENLPHDVWSIVRELGTSMQNPYRQYLWMVRSLLPALQVGIHCLWLFVVYTVYTEKTLCSLLVWHTLWCEIWEVCLLFCRFECGQRSSFSRKDSAVSLDRCSNIGRADLQTFDIFFLLHRFCKSRSSFSKRWRQPVRMKSLLSSRRRKMPKCGSLLWCLDGSWSHWLEIISFAPFCPPLFCLPCLSFILPGQGTWERWGSFSKRLMILEMALLTWKSLRNLSSSLVM